jgi:cell division protein FtsL
MVKTEEMLLAVMAVTTLAVAVVVVLTTTVILKVVTVVQVLSLLDTKSELHLNDKLRWCLAPLG